MTNHLPKVSGDDPALWARLRVIPFTVSFLGSEDTGLGDRLALAADAILTWAVRGLEDYRENGMSAPAPVTEATAEYRRDSDAIGRFIDERCIVAAGYATKFTDLYDAWTQWALEDGAEPISKKQLGQELQRRGFSDTKSTGGMRLRRGIALAAPDEDP